MQDISDDFDAACREPRGCRFIHGDPGGTWGYCQEALPAGVRFTGATVEKPPYCAEHSRLCVPPMEPFPLKKFYARAVTGVDDNVIVCSPNHGDTQRLPTDTLIKTNKDGSLTRD